MPFPASVYGQKSDVFATAALMPADLPIGQEQYDAGSGKTYKLLQANGAIPANSALNYDGTQASNNVVISNATGKATLGVNDNSGVALIAGNVFWATIKGPCTPLVTAATAAGVQVYCNTTAGTMTTATAADLGPVRCETRAASGAGGATACFLF